MRISTLRVVALLALALPELSQAQPKLAIGSIRGDASRVRRQLLLQLCGNSYDCVAATRVTTANRPDPQKLRRTGVAGYLGGAVTGEPGERRLFLTVTTPDSTARKPARTWRLKLTPDGRLRPQALDRFAAELDEVLQGAAARTPPSPAAPPQRPATPPPAATTRPPPAAATPPAAKPPPTAAKPAERPAEKVSEKPAEKPRQAEPRGAEGQLRFAAEAGLWITNRKLSYSGTDATATTSLRTFDASAILVPNVRVELYPGAFMGARPLLAGIGLRAGYGRSIGLQVKPPSGATEGNHSAALTTMDVGVVWRVQPSASSRFVIAPALGYRRLQLVTEKKDEVAIAGLPDTRLSGFELRVDGEFPVSSSLGLLAGGGYTLWTSKADLVSDDFFDKGSARAFQVDAGASYRIVGPLSVRALIEYQSTSYSSLKDPASGVPTASGASDKYLGGRIMARVEY